MNAFSSVPLISFVVPVYNGKAYLEACVASLLAQENTCPVEIILVDDGSTDGSDQMIDRMRAGHSGITALHQPNVGHTAARLNGLEHAKGDYVFFVDCDDCLEPNATDVLTKIIARYSPDAVIFGYTEFSDNGSRVVSTGIESGFYEDDQLKQLENRKLMMDGNGESFPRALWAKVFRRELVGEALRSISTEIITGEDMCASIKALLDSRSLYVTDVPLYRYRRSAVVSVLPTDSTALCRCLYAVRYLEGCVREDLPDLPAQMDRLVTQQVYSAALRELRSGVSCADFKKNSRAVLRDPTVSHAVRYARFTDSKLRVKRLILCFRLFGFIKVFDIFHRH
jgi:hypothetical protein